DLAGASSDAVKGDRISSRVPEWSTKDLTFEPHDQLLGRIDSRHLALLATPAKTSAAMVKALFDRNIAVVDLSGAYRLEDPAAYPEWYGFPHPHPELLPLAEYGLADLFPLTRGARIVANPGCYATAAILAAAPLLKSDLVKKG